jgi:hypothetical protein
MNPMFDHDLFVSIAYRDTKSYVRAELVEHQEIVQKAREHESWQQCPSVQSQYDCRSSVRRHRFRELPLHWEKNGNAVPAR